MRYLKQQNIYCFSPLAMIATFLIEIVLAVYTVWRYTLDKVTKLAALMLVLLALFQLAEYNVCEGSFGIDSLSWSRIGYVAITMLPPLGFHLATQLAGEKKTRTISLAYVTAGLFAGFFAFSGHGITTQACLGNYVIFKAAPHAAQLYSLYYYGWLIAGVVYMLRQAARAKQAHRSRALRALGIGYLAFILPTTTVNVIDPSTIEGIPSIMCGFAVILAIILAVEVLPGYHRAPSFMASLPLYKEPHEKIAR